MFLERFMTKEWASRFTWVCTVVVLLIGCGETAYWAWLGWGGANVMPHLAWMKSNTAVLLILCGIALATLHWKGTPSGVIRWGIAIMLVAFGTWTLLEFFNMTPFLVDQWIVADPTMTNHYAGRPAPNTAVAVVFAGVLLVHADVFKIRGGHVAQFLNWMIVALAGLQLIGYLFGAKSIYTLSQATPMAPLTCLALISFSIGMFMHYPGQGLLATFLDRRLTGRMLRLMLPMALLIPVIMEWLEVLGENAGWYSPEFGSAMMTVVTSGLLIIVVFRNAKSLRQLDSERYEALGIVALSEKRLQAILDNTPALVHIKDLKGRYVFVNRQFETVFGVSSRDIIGKTLYDMFPVEQATVLAEHDKVVVERGGVTEFENCLTHPDGKEHTYLTAKFLILDSAISEGVVCGISVDITVRKEAEVKIREVARLQSEFASIVSHEIRSPMTVIRGEVELVDEGILGPVTPDQKHHLGIALHSMDRLARLITNILDFQKLETGQVRHTIEPTDVVAIANDTIEGFQPVVAKKGVALRVTLPPMLPAALCDKDAMVEVLTNLIDNAIKYTDSGNIEIRAKDMGDHVKFEIEDSGVGIPEEEQGKLFKAFSRINVPGRRVEGSGLGLAICKKIVENNGGAIGVTSQSGKGATFFFTLPVALKTSISSQQMFAEPRH